MTTTYGFGFGFGFDFDLARPRSRAARIAQIDALATLAPACASASMR